MIILRSSLAMLLAFTAVFAASQSPAPQYPSYPSEMPDHLQPVTSSFDFERREAMIAMRDGVHLHTVILVPEGGQARAYPAYAHALQRRSAHHPRRQRAPRTESLRL